MKSTIIDLTDYAANLGLTVEELTGKYRKQLLCAARQAYWLHLHSQGYGYSEIGRMFNRNHVTVMHGIRRVKCLVETGDGCAIKCYNKLYNK